MGQEEEEEEEEVMVVEGGRGKRARAASAWGRLPE